MGESYKFIFKYQKSLNKYMKTQQLYGNTNFQALLIEVIVMISFTIFFCAPSFLEISCYDLFANKILNSNFDSVIPAGTLLTIYG